MHRGDHRHGERRELEEPAIDLPKHECESRQREVGDRAKLMRIAAHREMTARARQHHGTKAGEAAKVTHRLEHRSSQPWGESVEVGGVVQLELRDTRFLVEPQPNEIVSYLFMSRRNQKGDRCN